MKFFNKKKSTKKINLKEEVSKEQETSKTTSSQMKITVFRSTGGGGLSLASRFTATEKRDANNNLFSINEEKNFKEDLDFTQERVYEWINTDLELQGNRNKDKISKVKQKIKNQEDKISELKIKAQKVKQRIRTQEELVKEIKEDVKLNAQYNMPDEELKLRQYKIFYESLRKDKNGTYMVYEEAGIRSYYFKAVDGILYPYWWGENSMRVDPDLTQAKKTYVHENMVFKNEHSKFQNAFNWLSIIMLVIGVLFLLTGGWLTFSHTENMYSMAEEVNAGNIKCTNTLATCTEKYEYLASKCLLGIDTPTENNINNEKQDNNIAQEAINNNPLVKKIK